MSDTHESPAPVTAGILIIGDEILSGRTQDTNFNHIARTLGAIGIQVREGRTVPDVETEIVAALNAMRARWTYVFTTGGIGPTHDDITADAVAAAFGTGIAEHPDAIALLRTRYAEAELNAARRRMARVPLGGELVPNPVSMAPGFRVENVFVMAGVPMIMRAMLEGIVPLLKRGRVVQARTLSCRLPEGAIAEGLGAIQAGHGGVAIGSYPFYRGPGDYGTSVVLRSPEEPALAAATAAVAALIREKGGDPAEGDHAAGGGMPDTRKPAT